MFEQHKQFHFIGIGGAGMSAIASVLLARGYRVSGSDAKESIVTERLRAAGATIFIGHDGANVPENCAIVLSTAIRPENPEWQAAKARKLTVFHRSDVMAAIVNERSGIAVAGAHGKTTTTAMLAAVFLHAQQEPTVLIGGDVTAMGGNACDGKGEFVITEADESDGSFLKLRPQYAVITNIEDDHLDHYGDMDGVRKAFRTFLTCLRPGGKAFLCADQSETKLLAAEHPECCIMYGTDASADWQVKNIRFDGMRTEYELWHDGKLAGNVQLHVPGQHNVLNSAAAIALAQTAGIEPTVSIAALAAFGGVHRRFELKGEARGVRIIDDYAHHPTEIAATLAAARLVAPKRIVCVFQPHRFTRTQLLADEFGQAFANCDELVLTDIYSAGETPIPGISGETLVEAVARCSGKKAHYVPALEAVPGFLRTFVQEGDMVLTVGAGNIYQAGEQLLAELKSEVLA